MRSRSCDIRDATAPPTSTFRFMTDRHTNGTENIFLSSRFCTLCVLLDMFRLPKSNQAQDESIARNVIMEVSYIIFQDI